MCTGHSSSRVLNKALRRIADELPPPVPLAMVALVAAAAISLSFAAALAQSARRRSPAAATPATTPTRPGSVSQPTAALPLRQQATPPPPHLRRSRRRTVRRAITLTPKRDRLEGAANWIRVHTLLSHSSHCRVLDSRIKPSGN